MRGWQIDKDNDSLKRRKDSWRYYRGGQIGREICFLPGCPKMSKNEPSDQLTSRAMSVKYRKEAAAAFDRMKKGLVLPLTKIFWTIWWLLFWDSWSILHLSNLVDTAGVLCWLGGTDCQFGDCDRIILFGHQTPLVPLPWLHTNIRLPGIRQ